MSRLLILQALETLGGNGFFDEIWKQTGIRKENLNKILARMYYSGDIDRELVKRNMVCHLDNSGFAEMHRFLYKIKK